MRVCVLPGIKPITFYQLSDTSPQGHYSHKTPFTHSALVYAINFSFHVDVG